MTPAIAIGQESQDEIILANLEFWFWPIPRWDGNKCIPSVTVCQFWLISAENVNQPNGHLFHQDFHIWISIILSQKVNMFQMNWSPDPNLGEFAAESNSWKLFGTFLQFLSWNFSSRWIIMDSDDIIVVIIFSLLECLREVWLGKVLSRKLLLLQ